MTGIRPSNEVSCVIGTLTSVLKKDNKYHQINARICLEDEQEVSVVWFHSPYLYEKVCGLKGRRVLICGKFTWPAYMRMPGTVNPEVFTNEIRENQVIRPVYSHVYRMPSSRIQDLEKDILGQMWISDYYSLEFERKYDIPSLQKAFWDMHSPRTMEDNQAAVRRFMFDDMLYFTLVEREIEKNAAADSPIVIKGMKKFEKIRSGLPYTLTDDQANVLDRIVGKMKAGERVNGLIQGDVSCGKSIVAFLLSILMAENGYQTAIMAPNKVLAEQHYKNLAKLLKGTGIQASFYIGSSTAKEKREFLRKVSSGETDIVVGTTSLISKSVTYKNLGLAIVDEEHKFGVVQRNNLAEKGKAGVHTLIMTATPIPRTLATTIYNKRTELYSIKSLPGGRKRVKNCLTNRFPATINFLLKQLTEGHQAFIVCPMIDKNDKIEGVLSIEEVEKIYRPVLEQYGFACRVLTGKTKKAETESVMNDFRDRKIHVLMATSVVEVGVDVPNATLIIIHNAERFGLAGLHQLRGRVGRGDAQAYCIFFSDKLDNERLKVISTTTNGFEIAERDLEMRDPGDLLRGVRQSGKNHYIDLILSNRALYQKVKEAADELERDEKAYETLEKMRESFYQEEDQK